MSYFSALRVALTALLVHKTRSGLTSLGIVVGIGAVIAMASAGTGARRKLEERLETVGTNMIIIQAGGRAAAGLGLDQAPLTRQDADALRKQVGPLLAGVAEFQLSRRIATSRTGSWLTNVTGSTPDMRVVRNWRVVHGRFYTDEDLGRAAHVCVIGETVRKKLFPDNPNPVNETVRVDRLALRVVGVLGEKGQNPAGGDQDDEVIVPITTFQRTLAAGDRIPVILTAARTQALTDRARAEIARVLRERRHVQAGAEDFSVTSVQELADLGLLVADTLQWLVACIAGISLVVGGIGIMNIMLAAVTERTREIGIRMAVGATPFDVLIQFLLEAVVLALTGGALGVGLGLLTAFGVARWAGWPLAVVPTAVTAAFAVTAAVGVFFGFYPAWKAARLDPVAALGYE